MRLFVFGTLKCGFPLHDELGGAPCLGLYRTVEAFPMFVAGPRFAPMMLDEPGTGYRVRGELCDIDEARRARIDRVESIGRPGHFSKTIAVERLDGGGETDALVYMKARWLAIPAHTGHLADYQDRRFAGPQT